MKNLVVGLILGLLAAVHVTPVNTVTLTQDESDVLQEAMEDEFLIPSLTTRNPSIQTSRQPSTDFKKSEMTESSHDRFATATQSVSKALSAISTTRDTRDSKSDPFRAQDYQSTERTREKMMDYPDSTSGFGSGDEAIPVQYPATLTNMTSSPRKGASAALSTSTAPPLTTGSEDSYSGSGMSDFTESTPAAHANTQSVLMAHPYSTSSSADVQTLGQYPTTVFSMSSSTRQEASDDVSTSTAPTPTTGGADTDSESGMREFTESTIATKITTNTMSAGQTHSTLSSDVKSRRGAILEQYPATVSSMTSSPGTEATSAASAAPPELVSTESEVSVKKANPAMAPIEFENGKYITVYPSGDSLSTGNFPKPMEEFNSVSAFSLQGLYKGSDETARNTIRGTPGWIVILACIVGVAVLVIVCVAIITRERWYGPNQVSQLETKTSQQKDLEMETFLHKDKPREHGGNAAEFTLISLDELP